ncbi:MAG: sensor histidine kinase [Aeromicrobium sp.]
MTPETWDDERIEALVGVLRDAGARSVAGTMVNAAGLTHAKSAPVERLGDFHRAGLGAAPVWDVFCLDAGIAFTDDITAVGDLRLRIDLTADLAVDTLRDVARGIYPPLLESEGLAAALSAQSRRVELGVTVLDRAGTRYPRDIEATAYFCAVEALRNAARHANAEHAHVELDGDDASLTVTVSDDGDGFDLDTTTRGDGLAHMLDRADAAGGTLGIASHPGHGTTITLTLPAS